MVASAWMQMQICIYPSPTKLFLFRREYKEYKAVQCIDKEGSTIKQDKGECHTITIKCSNLKKKCLNILTKSDCSKTCKAPKWFKILLMWKCQTLGYQWNAQRYEIKRYQIFVKKLSLSKCSNQHVCEGYNIFPP